MKIQIQKIQLYNFFHYCLLLGTVGLINRNPNYSHKLTHGKLLKQNINLKSKKKRHFNRSNRYFSNRG